MSSHRTLTATLDSHRAGRRRQKRTPADEEFKILRGTDARRCLSFYLSRWKHGLAIVCRSKRPAAGSRTRSELGKLCTSKLQTPFLTFPRNRTPHGMSS